MLQNHKGGGATALKTHGFIIATEVEAGVNLEHLANKLAESIQWVEGVGEIAVDYLGEIELYDDETDHAVMDSGMNGRDIMEVVPELNVRES